MSDLLKLIDFFSYWFIPNDPSVKSRWITRQVADTKFTADETIVQKSKRNHSEETERVDK
jgi:hypothetical protein